MVSTSRAARPTDVDAYGWDDIGKYQRVQYRGVNGYILDKGPHLSSAAGEHVYIELDEEPERGNKEVTLHRRLVESYIKEQRVLWVDWDRLLSPYAPDK